MAISLSRLGLLTQLVPRLALDGFLRSNDVLHGLRVNFAGGEVAAIFADPSRTARAPYVLRELFEGLRRVEWLRCLFTLIWFLIVGSEASLLELD